MDWTCGLGGRTNKYIQNFGGETSWKIKMVVKLKWNSSK